MRKCLGKHLCMSNSFPIVILNDASFFSTVQLQAHKREFGARWRHYSQCTSNPVSTKLKLDFKNKILHQLCIFCMNRSVIGNLLTIPFY